MNISIAKKVIKLKEWETFKQLLKIVRKYVSHFQNDFLVYDKAYVLSQGRKKYIWFVRDDGTSLCIAPESENDHDAIERLEGTLQFHQDNRELVKGVYLFTLEKVEKLSLDKFPKFY